MIKKVLGRSLGGTAIAGLVLTAAPVAVSPAFVPLACEYPVIPTTSTTLTLQQSVASFGTKTTATINVQSGAGTVTGKVRLVVNGNTKGLTDLVNGQSVRVLPRKLIAGRTHVIRAEYVGNCSFNASSQQKKYSVFKARTTTKARVKSARAAKFRARVIGSTGLVVRKGKVAFIVKNAQGVKIRSSIRRVRRGVAITDLRNLSRGNYKLVARYLGSQNWKASRGVKRFKVR
ncbi:MAG TPA: Ig-like domain-containing protein [Nocardioidaceae bacterium]|nr:Ig-like domain-containing protein [Nocardioidaceae bacterium]